MNESDILEESFSEELNDSGSKPLNETLADLTLDESHENVSTEQGM